MENPTSTAKILLLLDSIKSNNHFAVDLKKLLLKHPNVDILAMGFPMGW